MTVTILQGDTRDVLKRLPDRGVQACVTSPPYFGLRQYLPDGHEDFYKQIGLETSPGAYVAELVAVFREVRRVLRDDGVLFLNLGDSYAMSTKGAGGQGKQHTNAGSVMSDRSWAIPRGIKPKDLIGIPWMVAFALRADGWWLRSDIIWHKPNPMPESVTDRPTSAHEHVFLLAKSARYFYDAEAIAEPAITAGEQIKMADGWDTGSGGHGTIHRDGREKGRSNNATQAATRTARNVWTIPSHSFPNAHFATFPPALAERCIKAGSRPGDTILDPFSGAGTTCLVADRLGRDAIGIELNPVYSEMAHRRVVDDCPLFAEVVAR